MRYKSVIKVLMLMVVFGFVSCHTTQKAVKVKKTSQYKFNFEDSALLSSVLDKAGSENKLVYLDVSAEWCAPCQIMKRDVYSHQETADFFNENFINYLVDAEKGEGPDLKLIFGVSSFPTLLILDSKGRIVHRREGGTFHEALILFGKDALTMVPN